MFDCVLVFDLFFICKIDSSSKKKLERHDSFGSSSSQGSNSSCTPFHPKKKRKILASRSAKNIREIRTSNSTVPGDHIKTKRLSTANKWKQSFLNLISTKSKRKRKHLSSSDEENCYKLPKKSTGLSSVLSDLRFSSNHSDSIEFKDISPDSVFSHSPTARMNISGSEIHEKISEDSSMLNLGNPIRLHSSLIEEKSKKMVNFRLESSGLHRHAEEVSNISLRGLSDCSSIASHAAFHRAERFKTSEHSNFLLCTPNSNKKNQDSIMSVSIYVDIYIYICICLN